MSRVRDADFFRLKAAMADLLERCGGLARSGALVGLSTAMMGKVNDRKDAAFLSIDAKLRLERDCGAPLVTQVEADLLGLRLERGAASAGALPVSPYAAVAAIGQEYADLVGGFAQSTLDGDFSRADAARADRDLAELIARAEAFRKFIAAQMATPS